MATTLPTTQPQTFSAATEQAKQLYADPYKQQPLPAEGQRGTTQFPSVEKQPQLQEQVLKSTWDRPPQQTVGFQQQYAGAQPQYAGAQPQQFAGVQPLYAGAQPQQFAGAQPQYAGAHPQQFAGAQPLQGQGIAGGSFNRELGVGVINLKPICIEQEPVMYRPQALTVPQPPLMIQPEAIQIPQPPIVIHPEPIVIPQPPLTFQPPAVAVPRPAVTIQPEAVVLNRPAYSVQPTIQFDLHGCNRFNQPDFKQHVHVKLSGQQALSQVQSAQQYPGQFQTVPSQQMQMTGQPLPGQQLQGQPLPAQQWGTSPNIAASQQTLQSQQGMGLNSPSYSGQQTYRLSTSATNTPQSMPRAY
jgi:hypothetical protein